MIVTEQLVKIYDGGAVRVVALRGVDVCIGRGEFVAIMGASGSGKSTLLHLLGCLDRPTRGRYLLEGQDVSRLSNEQLAALRNKKIGFVFQSFHLLPRMSARENVELPLLYSRTTDHARHARALAALRAVGLEAHAAHSPSQLSGGQQQRVAIARALVNEPVLLLADEPTGNLDSHTSADIMELLQTLNIQRGVTIIVVTHAPEIARYAQRVILCQDGLVVEDRAVSVARPSQGLGCEPVAVSGWEDGR